MRRVIFAETSRTSCSCHSHSWLLIIMTGLYRKGLVYLDVPIADTDYIVGKLVLWILTWQVLSLLLIRQKDTCLMASLILIIIRYVGLYNVQHFLVDCKGTSIKGRPQNMWFLHPVSPCPFLSTFGIAPYPALWMSATPDIIKVWQPELMKSNTTV